MNYIHQFIHKYHKKDNPEEAKDLKAEQMEGIIKPTPCLGSLSVYRRLIVCPTIAPMMVDEHVLGLQMGMDH